VIAQLGLSTELEQGSSTSYRRQRQEENDRPLELDLLGNEGCTDRHDDLDRREGYVEQDRFELVKSEALCGWVSRRVKKGSINAHE
jgi:hypothetical protein